MLSVWERYFPAPYGDNQLLCSLFGPKWRHAFNFYSLQTQQLDLVIGNFWNFTPRIAYTRHDLQRSEIQKISLGGMPPDPPSKRAVRALIARRILEPPFSKFTDQCDQGMWSRNTTKKCYQWKAWVTCLIRHNYLVVFLPHTMQPRNSGHADKTENQSNNTLASFPGLHRSYRRLQYE